MPLRTPRGRSAAYRHLLGWTIRTRRNMVLTAVAVVAVGVGIAVAVAQLAPAPTAPNSAGMTTVTTRPLPPNTPMSIKLTTAATSTRSPTPTTASASPNTPPAATTGGGNPAVEAARAFARAFIHHPEGISSQTWLAQLTPTLMPETVATLKDVDPQRIPDTALTGEPVEVSRKDHLVVVDVPTNAAGLRVTVLSTPDGWRVQTYQPRDES